MAAVLHELGVRKGDRVLIYMPMIPEAAFAMLACARIGAIHSVVFGGFASGSLANRIDDAEPRSDRQRGCGQPRRQGRCPYKPLLDEAIRLAEHKPAKVLMVDRGLAPASLRGEAATSTTRRAASATSTRRCRASGCRRHAIELHALHQRHDRQAEGRAARHRRLRGGAGRQHEAHLPRATRARPSSPPATSAGSSATATSSTAR